MNNETSERTAFEAWIVQPPYEHSTSRYPNYPERYAWPGQYRALEVELAWSAWQARASAATQAVPEPKYRYYITQPSESLAGIALRELKDGSRWVEIRDLNEYDFPDMRANEYYPVGTQLRLPAAAPVVPPVALPALTDEQIDREWMRWNLPTDDSALAFYRLSASEQVRAAFVDGLKRGVVLAASAAPAPEQMQPNAGAENAQRSTQGTDMTDTTELVGTFACPICGQATPHHHSERQVAAYRDDQVRDDGWVSVAYKLPTSSSGFYLIRGHTIEVPKPDYNNVSYNAYQRISERYGYPAEVAEWGVGFGQTFTLLHWSGNARVDGSEGRTPVTVNPTHWRELPPFGVIRTPGVSASDRTTDRAALSAVPPTVKEG